MNSGRSKPGFSRLARGRPGIVALFAGPSAAGKTMGQRSLQMICGKNSTMSISLPCGASTSGRPKSTHSTV